MIITRTPFRISFFGGGTDYPAWFLKHGGRVLSATIDKYCYISCRRLPPFFDHKHRIVYSQIENTISTNDIKHPAVKAVLQWSGIGEGLEIHHDGDLPARSGLGSSSAFTVGLVHALEALRGRYASKYDLARNAIHIEQDLIQENVGSQDQVAAAYGGFNVVEFHKNGLFDVSPVIVDPKRLNEFWSHLMLCFTGVSRYSSVIAKSTIDNLNSRETELSSMQGMVAEALSILQNHGASITQLGELLHQSWQIKRTLSDSVSTPDIDQTYATARAAGAGGGKILGAGGGGFMLLFAKPANHARIRERLQNLIHVPFRMDQSGSKVVLYQPSGL